MTYLSGRTYKRKRYTLYGVCISMLFLVVMFWPFIQTHTYPVIEPVVTRYGITKSSLVVFPEFFRTYSTSHKTLIARQHELEITIEQLENTLAEKNALIKEYAAQGDSSGATEPKRQAPIILYPFMQDITKLYSTLLLSKGFKDGITIGDIVYVRGNQAVCTIKEVYTASSLCLLLTSSGVITEGVTSESAIMVTLVGRGGHYLADIVRDTQVSKGEKVYMRSNPSFVLGTVQDIANNNQDTSWHVFVQGAYNPLTSSVFYVQPH